MAIPVTCDCGETFSLKDELAGQVLRCPKCGAALQVGKPVTAPLSRTPQADPAFDRDKFLLRQKHFAIAEKYYVHDENGNPIIFVQRPAHLARKLLGIFGTFIAIIVWWVLVIGVAEAFSSQDAKGMGFVLGFLGMFPVMIAVMVALSPKRHVTFYRDDTKSEKLLEVLQDRKWQIPTATYTVRDPQGQVLARLRKNYLYNIFRKRWQCEGPNGQSLCLAKEDSILLSMLRRLLGPLFGLLRTNFIILRDEDVIGEFNRKFTILDRYVLDLSADPQRNFDRRIALALGVMLDSGERR